MAVADGVLSLNGGTTAVVGCAELISKPAGAGFPIALGLIPQPIDEMPPIRR